MRRGNRDIFVLLIILWGGALCGCGKGVGAQSCTQINQALNSALTEFNPSSSSSCASDADCTLDLSVPIQNGVNCATTCGTVMTTARSTEYKAFLASNQDVTTSCSAFVKNSCPLPALSCGSFVAKCVSGACIKQ